MAEKLELMSQAETEPRVPTTPKSQRMWFVRSREPRLRVGVPNRVSEIMNWRIMYSKSKFQGEVSVLTQDWLDRSLLIRVCLASGRFLPYQMMPKFRTTESTRMTTLPKNVMADKISMVKRT